MEVEPEGRGLKALLFNKAGGSHTRTRDMGLSECVRPRNDLQESRPDITSNVSGGSARRPFWFVPLVAVENF